MAFTMMLWEISDEKLIEVPSAQLNQENRLEDWIVADPSLLGLDAFILSCRRRKDL